MNRRRLVWALALVFAAAALLLFILANHDHLEHSPPVLALVGAEAAGVFDENDDEMVLATIRILNMASEMRDVVFVKSTAKPLEARVQTRWIALEPVVVEAGVYPRLPKELQVLLPAGVDCCRIPLKYSGGAKSFKARVFSLTDYLPPSLRYKVLTSLGVHPYLGVSPYWSSKRDWHELLVEVPCKLPQ